MTHEEKEIEMFCAEIHDLGMRDVEKTISEEDSECEYKKWVDYIKDALASAKKKAYENGREEGIKHQHALDLSTYGSATMELPPTEAYQEGWNEAIAEAVKVAEGEEPERIADKIKGLKK